jgi:hypothetical protein
MNENKIQVTKEEFDEFIRKYNTNVHKLERDTCGIFDPPVVSYNDFSLGDWPESVVAHFSWGESNYGRFDTKEENDKYCVNKYYIKKELLNKPKENYMNNQDYKTRFENLFKDWVDVEKGIREAAAKVLEPVEVYGSETVVEPTLVEVVEKLVEELESLHRIIS